MVDTKSLPKCPKQPLCRNAKNEEQCNCAWNYDNGTCEGFAPERRTDNYAFHGEVKSENIEL